MATLISAPLLGEISRRCRPSAAPLCSARWWRFSCGADAPRRQVCAFTAAVPDLVAVSPENRHPLSRKCFNIGARETGRENMEMTANTPAAQCTAPSKTLFGCSCHASRRSFLAGAAAFAATAIMRSSSARLRARTRGRTRWSARRHFYRRHQKAWGAWEDAHKIPHLGVGLHLDAADEAFEDMDEAGITTGGCCRWRRRRVCDLRRSDRKGARHARGCAAPSPPRWCTTGPATTACSRHCRCSTSTPRSRKSIAFDTLARRRDQPARPTTATSGSDTPPTSR